MNSVLVAVSTLDPFFAITLQKVHTIGAASRPQSNGVRLLACQRGLERYETEVRQERSASDCPYSIKLIVTPRRLVPGNVNRSFHFAFFISLTQPLAVNIQFGDRLGTQYH